MLNLLVAPSDLDKNATKATRIITKYLKLQKVEYSVFFSKDFENLKQNIEELLSFGENEFVIIGDDSVLNTFINSIKELTKVKFGIVPTGRFNDFATYLGLTKNPIEEIKIILEKHIENVDFLLVNDIRVINNIIIGASVEAEEKFAEYKMKNVLTHTFADMKYASKFDGVELNISSKNMKTLNERIFELIVANGGLNKGQQISPLSNLKDGNFNLLYSTQKTKKFNNKFFKDSKNGNHIYNEETKQLWLDNLKITNKDKSIKCLLDGKIKTFEQLDITLIEGGLKIYTKK